MTIPRKWWFEKGDGNEVFVRVKGKSGTTEPLKHNQAPNREYSAVVRSQPYEKDGPEKDSQCVKIFFKRKQDGSRVFNPKFFVWNASDICSQFRETIADTSQFCDKLNQLTASSSLVITQAQIHQEDNISDGSSLTFDWDISGNDVPDIGLSSANGVVHSTPARVPGRSETRVSISPIVEGSMQSIPGTIIRRPSKRAASSPVEDLPVLFKKKREVEMSVELRIMEEVKKAYLGSARIPTAHLKLGTQLRQIREPFVIELMAKMKEFPGHFYQPLCVIIDSLDDVSHFKETSASGYHYNVIGGCHNFSAAKRLNQMHPAQDIFKSRLCSIYSNSLSAEAMLWLANRHNKVGEFRHHMSLKEKIQLCRNIFETSGMNVANRDWQTTVTSILSPEESKGVIKLLIKLATLENETYQLLQEVLSCHSNGQLKGQKLTPSEITNGPDLKPYALRSIPGLPASAARKVLSETRDGNMGMAELQKEAKLLLKLQIVQKMFLDLLGLKNWDDAQKKYPTASTREVLEHFCKFNLRSTPPELKTFCHQLKMEETASSSEAFRGDRGSLGYPVNCNVLLLDWETILEAVPTFSGAALIILDKPQEWTWTDVKTFANNITSVNIHHQMDSFSLVVLSTVSESPSVEKAIKESRHFSDLVSAYYMVQNETKGDDEMLIDSVGSITIARKNQVQPFSWKEGHCRNYVEVGKVELYMHDGCPVDEEQKPVSLYQELIAALSHPKEWIVDACSGTGTGCLAALLEDRCVLSLEQDVAKIQHMKVRLSASLGGSSIQKRLTDCANGEDDNQDSEEDVSLHEPEDEDASSHLLD